MMPSVTGTALIGSLAAMLANEAPVTSSTSLSLVEYVTAGALVIATIFSFWFWYVANRPNVIIKPTLKSGSTTVVITNMGKSQAEDVRVSSESLKLSRHSDETLDIRLPTMYPQEEIEYYVAPGSQTVAQEPYEFDVSHRRWLWRWPREKRRFIIDFKQYEHSLADLHVSTPFENHLEDIARIGQSLIQMHVNKKDRFRFRKEIAKYRARKLRERLITKIRRTNKSDG